ncbi:MAG: lactate utilization protein B [Halieaceae bacterium]|jgi:L-lactate dehydrogenase complex protein LldF|nr:lactate utilization protein B [Halieaceae bacterium]
MQLRSEQFQLLATDAMADRDARERRDVMGLLLPAVRDQAVAQLGDFEGLRQHVKKIKDHTLNHLSHYLQQFEEQVVMNGGHVHWARDSAELNRIVLDICRQAEAREVGKGKSMITEETGLTADLEAAGFRVTETDLGEYIVQVAGETPSHIVGPAFHKSEQEIRDLFFEQHDLGDRDLPDPPAMVQEARAVLRERFLAADVGIIGSNALIAETGQTMLVTNEGNGDLVSTLPRVQIVCASIEKVLPRPEDALNQLRLLVSSAIGTTVTAYTSFYAGPRRSDDEDGPAAFHVVLLDNRRSEILGGNYQDMLACMRCGACLNHCPVYVGAGGHAYGWVYPGPMGSVLTPLLTSLEAASELPNACTGCGRCEEVCPAAIPLPDLLRDLRAEEHNRKITPARWRHGMDLHSRLTRWPRLYHAVTGVAIALLHRLGRRRGMFHRLPFAGGWTAARDFPAPEGDTFMQQWRRQQRVAASNQASHE